MKLFLSILAILVVLTGQPAQAKPNIILILVDDMTVPMLKNMPNVKQYILDEGVTFTNSVTDFALCCPYRASLFTGLAAHNHGIKDHDAPGGWEGFRSFESNTLPLWLQDAGYKTAMIGKYVNRYDGSVVPPGWNEWFAFVPHGYFNYDLTDNGVLVHYGTD